MDSTNNFNCSGDLGIVIIFTFSDSVSSGKVWIIYHIIPIQVENSKTNIWIFFFDCDDSSFNVLVKANIKWIYT